MTDTEKQFAGNYVRLVNKSRSLEQDVILKDRMIDLMAKQYKMSGFEKEYIEKIKQQAISELVAEQNKKAADSESI